jgi:hypothetical protein
MINQNSLKEIIVEQKKLFLDVKNSYKRQILNSNNFNSKFLKTKEIIIITGVRRCGKSYLMKLIWQKIKEKQNINDKQCLYFNFEDERLINFDSNDFNTIMESYLDLSGPNTKKTIYLFFDEIQNIKNWDKFLNRLREDKKYKIFVSGSNATLLSKEISTKLTGRNLPINLYPFSFEEYVWTKMPKFQMNDIYNQEKKIRIKKIFGEYLKNGGFPEVVRTAYRPLLQEYFKNIIYRDIVLRYRIKYQASLKEMTNFLLTNTGTALSFEEISKMVRIPNLTTIKNYLKYIEDSFLFSRIPIYDYSIKKQIYNPDKVYVCDLGIYAELGFKFSRNAGKILENFVFNELKMEYPDIYYGPKIKKGGEIDFIVAQKNKITKLIQVCFDLSDFETKKRETSALLNTMAYYKLKQGIIFTDDFEKEKKYPEGKISFIPAWKYFLK